MCYCEVWGDSVRWKYWSWFLFLFFHQCVSDLALSFLFLLLFSLSTADTGRLTFSTMCKHSDDIPQLFFVSFSVLVWLSNIIDIWNWLTLREKKNVEVVHYPLPEHSWWVDANHLFAVLLFWKKVGAWHTGIDLPIQMGVVLNCRVNVSVGPQEDRMMTSGRHTVADIYCNCCQQLVGWKYVLFTYTHLLASAFGCQYHVIRLSQKLFNPIYWLWQESAYEKSQKYKEGKFILER